jgi:outer membrane protein assembly factor BamD
MNQFFIKALSVFAILSLFSCNKFTKVLTSTDATYKEAMANKYLAAGDCDKSTQLYDDLLNLYRGTAKAEKIYFKLAESHFCEESYLLSAHYFNNFQKNYTRSERREEALYMIGRSYEGLSPESSLDQEYSEKAVQFYDYFLNKFPLTERKEEVDKRIKKLKSKILEKEKNITLHYLKTEEFKSAIRAINLFLQEHPDSEFDELMKFSLVDAYYKLAYNSVESKKANRYTNVIIAFQDFKSSFPESSLLEKATKLKLKSEDWRKNNINQ